MQCSFCHEKINRFLYACSQHPQVTACEGCRDYTCNRCRGVLNPVTMQFCTGCQSYQEACRMFGEKYESFCYDCCLEAYKQNSKGKKVVLRNHICQPDKFDVYCFLKKFCYQCLKNLEKERSQGIDSGLREIYPLETNLCSDCSSLGLAPVKNQNLSKSRSTKSYNQLNQQSSTDVHDSSSNLSSSRSNNFSSYNYEPGQSKRVSPPATPTFSTSTSTANFAKQTPLEKWKRIQNVSNEKFLRCLACGHLMLDDGLINEQILLCSYCTRRSEAQEQIINQENIRKSRRREQEQYQDPNYLYKQKQTDFDFYDPYKNTQPKQNVKQHQPKTTITATLSPKSKQTYSNERNEQSSLQNKTQNLYFSNNTRNNPLRKLGSDGFMERVALNIQYPVESQLISCDKCGVEMEITALLWEEKENVPLCRCCFAENLDKAKESRNRYERYSNNYTTQSQSSSQANRDKIRKQQLQSKLQSPIQTRQPRVQLSNSRKQSKSPDLIEYSPQKPSPQRRVQPSPKRSQQTMPSNVGKIVQNGPANNTKATPVSYADMRKASQPEIIEDKPSKKIIRSESWDDKILMEPVEDHERRKRNQRQAERNQIPQQNQSEAQNDQQKQKLKQPSKEPRITEEYIKQSTSSSNSPKKDTRANSSNVNAGSKNIRLESQPTIVEQKEQRSRRVNKRESWNDQIILEPLADHLERKKQQSKAEDKQRENEKASGQKTKVQQANINSKAQAKSKSPEGLPKIDERNEQKQSEKVSDKKQSYDDFGYTQRKSEEQNYRRAEMQKLIQLEREMHEFEQKQMANKRRHIPRENFDNFDPYNEIEKSYISMKRRIQENIADSENRWRNFDENRKTNEIFDRARKEAYDRYYRHQQADNVQRLSDSRSRYSNKPESTTIPTTRTYVQPTFTYSSSGYTSPKASERSTNLSNSRGTATNARQETYYDSLSGSRTQTMKNSRDNFDHYQQKPRREGFTGFRVLEQKMRKVCSLCQNVYTTTYKDYYAGGSNVCLDCYGEYNRRSRQ